MPQGNVIAAHGNTLIGKMHWRSDFAEFREIGFQNPFDAQQHGYMFTIRDDLQAFHNVTAASLFNCWEATFYIAYTASLQLVDNPDNEIRKKVLATDFSDINYVPCIEKFLGCNNLRTWDQHVQAGDVVFFYGNAHIALSLGGSNVLSLWNGPDDDWHLQQTTIQALQAKVKGNAFTYYHALRTLLTGKSDAFWSQHIHNVSAMFDALDDLRDTHKAALDEESEPSLQQKEAALQAVQQFVAKYQFEQLFPHFGLEYSSQPFLNW
ncbi:MAG TPA: hypothetical protein VKY19_24675 [Ktedonosporobacter sp.]|jgi:hypothetical protein|nr:hypothetical protein [Ktedonosporobacter sp.]